MLAVDGLIFASMIFIFLLPICDGETARLKFTVGTSLFVLLAASVLAPHLVR